MPGWLVWIVIGGLAGFLAGNFMGAKRPYGIPGDVVLGIVGAVVGGFLLGLLNLGAKGIIGDFVIAFLGAVVLIWGIRKLS